MSEQEPVVVISYWDVTFEFDDGDADGPKLMSVYGVEHPSRFGPEWTAVVSETGSDGDMRGITHIPNSLIEKRDVVRPAPLNRVLPMTEGTH